MDSLSTQERDRPVVELTEDMISEGANVLLDFVPDSGVSFHECVADVFRAMIRSEPSGIFIKN